MSSSGLNSVPPASSYSLMTFSKSAMPSSTDSKFLMGFRWRTLTFWRSSSRRIDLPWSMYLDIRLHASTPFKVSALLNMVSAEPESAFERKPHIAALVVSICSSFIASPMA